MTYPTILSDIIIMTLIYIILIKLKVIWLYYTVVQRQMSLWPSSSIKIINSSIYGAIQQYKEVNSTDHRAIRDPTPNSDPITRVHGVTVRKKSNKASIVLKLQVMDSGSSISLSMVSWLRRGNQVYMANQGLETTDCNICCTQWCNCRCSFIISDAF